MFETLPLTVIALVLLGMSLALVIKTSSAFSTLIKVIVASAFVAVLVLALADPYRELVDEFFALVARHKMYTAAFAGGVIIGALFPRRTLG